MNDSSPDNDRPTNGEAVVLIHGTGASDLSDEGTRWWQRGSGFCEALADQLSSEGCTVQEKVFHWSGGNSERDREKAGTDLLNEFLIHFEADKRAYHLIAHSHGGSIVLVALTEAMRRNIELTQLKSIATLGRRFCASLRSRSPHGCYWH